LIKEVKFLIKL